MTFTRRTALATAAAASLIPAWARAEDSPEAMAALGVIYALPLVEMYATRRRAEAMGQAGRLVHAPRLADASSRAVTTPNVDTLYSTGWFDLAGGPTVVEMPPAGPAYVSLAFMDAWSNNFVVLPGAGAKAPRRAVLTGPGGATPADGAAAALRSPTRHVWLLGRTFAASNAPEDLAPAHALQAQIKAQGSPTSPAEPPIEKTALSPEDPVAFFALANRLMAEEGVLPADGAVLAKLRAVGVGPNLTFVNSPATRAGAAAAWARLKAFRQKVIDGWRYPQADLGDFGVNYEYRAQTALTGLAALPRSEAVYLFGDGDGKGAPGTYDGRHDWRLSFRKGQEPPCDAFWSLTLYERTPEGRQYFFPNPANRFAVASHTPGLKRGPEGGLAIAVQAEPPADPTLKANWLPAPKGPFTLVLRLYKPKEAMTSGKWKAPPLRAV